VRFFESRPWGHLGELSEESLYETLNASVVAREDNKKQVKQILLYVVSRILKGR